MSEAVADDAMSANHSHRSHVAGSHLAPPPPGTAAWTTNQRPAPGILKKTLSKEDPQQQQEDYIYSQLTKFWDSCESTEDVAMATSSRASSASTA
ncbi:hypothetical protein FHG87_024565 [Trinorchestia longiramus]|nr:hypothetical protein FHG87_024565 [Trinorchestia longiramus]